MEYSKFRNILETLRDRCELEDELYALGIDMANLKYNLSGPIMELFDEIYPESKGDVEWFCWETDFGRDYHEGGAIDEYGRDCDLSSIDNLYTYLEHRKGEDNIFGEPYYEKGVLANGWYRGVFYRVTYSGVSPCAYIDIAGMREGVRDVVDQYCHGGVTWEDNHTPFFEEEDEGYFVGWDYGHISDWTNYDYASTGHRWTTREIVDEIKRVINKMGET